MSATSAKFVAAVLTAVVGAAIALAQIRMFGAVRYAGGFIINIIALGLLTMAWSVPGAILIVVAAYQGLRSRHLSNWIVASLIGAAIAGVGATLLAFAADCVPQCKGARGSLDMGLLFGIPAGFAVGATVFVTWCWLHRLVATLIARRMA